MGHRGGMQETRQEEEVIVDIKNEHLGLEKDTSLQASAGSQALFSMFRGIGTGPPGVGFEACKGDVPRYFVY